MSIPINTYKRVGRIVHTIGGIFIFLFFLVTLINVLSRYVFNAPIAIGDEIAFYIFFYSGMIGIYYGYSLKVHVNVDLIKSKLPKQTHGWLELFTSIITEIIWTVVLWQGMLEVVDLITRTHTIHQYILPVPLWCTLIGVPLIALLIIIENLLSFVIPSIYFLKRKGDKSNM